MKRPKMKKPRNEIALAAILAHKGGPMRDRRARRPKDARNNPVREDW